MPVPDYSNILVLDGMAIAEHLVDQLGASEVQYAVVRPLVAGMVMMNCSMSRVVASLLPVCPAREELSGAEVKFRAGEVGG